MSFFIFLTLLSFVFSVVPLWNVKYSAINLLENSNNYSYIITHRYMYNLEAILEKVINKNNEGKIIHENFLYIKELSYGDSNNDIYSKEKVSFENIDSFYSIDLSSNHRSVLCPMGKYHVINLDTKKEINNRNFDENNKNWVLKCNFHISNQNYNNYYSRYFFVFYLLNGINQVYGFNGDNYEPFSNLQLYEEMYDFKLEPGDSPTSNGNYSMCSLVKYQGFIQFIGTEYILRDSFQPMRSPDLLKQLIIAKEFSQAVFDNYTNNFYYFTYNNASDFCSGYSNKTVSDYNYYTNDVNVINNYSSPFEFMDKVEIKEMKFLYYTKYVYYSIYNNKTLQTYHGVLDITLNKIVFNTNEEIDVFIPYSNNSMLAITKETAYRICFIKGINGDCVDKCSNSDKIIFDMNGNKCGTECDTGKYLMIPEKICSLKCSNDIYISIGNKCGLCRDLNNTNKYKLINGTECLSEIIDGSEIYNEQLFLLVCKRGYIINGNKCIADIQEQKELKYNNFTNFTECKNEFMTNIRAYIDSSQFWNGSNCETKILRSNDIGINDSIKINISEIFLGACPQILKEHYNISNEESLILLIMENTKNKNKNENSLDNNAINLGIDILLNIFDIFGRQLDLFHCQSFIRITHNISQFNELDIKSAKNFAKKGIDVFNASDSFFNDLCHPYDDEDGNDIILYDRREDFYQNVTFCQQGCSYSNIDYDLTSVVCLVIQILYKVILINRMKRNKI